MVKLTPKQQKFCDEYLVDLNATQAAIRAGYSKKTANEIGAQNLAKVSIQEYLTAARQRMQERTEITADMVVKELARIGFHNVKDFVNGGNSVLELKFIDEDKTAAVSAVKNTVKSTYNTATRETTTDTITEIKFHDKVSALEKLGRHLGIFEKDNGQRKLEISGVLVTTQEAKDISAALEGEV